MKKIFKLILVALLVYAVLLFAFLPRYIISDATVELREDDDSIVIMSTNLRCLMPNEFLQKSWFYRADLISKDINSVKPDIIGFQEATAVHYDYLEDFLEGYDSEIAYRDNTLLSEGCPIFYRTDKFEKVDSGHFWLSQTPDVMSKDWGSAHYRICIYVILKDVASGKEFVVFNTHLDHKSTEARVNGIQVVVDKIAEFGNIPAYLMGDLNATEDSDTIEFTKESFDDAMRVAPVSEETATYHNWGNDEASKRIDYIMISKTGIEILEYHVLDNCYDGAYSSDHASIYVITKLK